MLSQNLKRPTFIRQPTLPLSCFCARQQAAPSLQRACSFYQPANCVHIYVQMSACGCWAWPKEHAELIGSRQNHNSAPLGSSGSPTHFCHWTPLEPFVGNNHVECSVIIISAWKSQDVLSLYGNVFVLMRTISNAYLKVIDRIPFYKS